jgi:hypothetical protein
VVTISAGRQGGGQERRPARLVRVDVVGVGERQPDVVEPVEQPPAGEVVQLEADRRPAEAKLPGLQVDGQLGRRVLLGARPQLLDDVLGHDDREQPGLERVAAEDVAEPR